MPQGEVERRCPQARLACEVRSRWACLRKAQLAQMHQPHLVAGLPGGVGIAFGQGLAEAGGFRVAVDSSFTPRVNEACLVNWPALRSLHTSHIATPVTCHARCRAAECDGVIGPARPPRQSRFAWCLVGRRFSTGADSQRNRGEDECVPPAARRRQMEQD